MELLCERGDALVFVPSDVAATVLLPRSALTFDEVYELLYAPVELPPGVERLTHCCPLLQYDGLSETEATFEVELQRDGAYFIGGCPECGVQVRSAAVEE